MTEVIINGRVYLTCDIHAMTGVRIGSTRGDSSTAALTNPVLRHALTGEPYLPGSALRGKLRSLWEKWNAAPQNDFIRRDAPPVRIHSPLDRDGDQRADRDIIDGDRVARIFGVNGDLDPALPTRLTITDFHLSRAYIDAMRHRRIASLSEIKTEVSLDRLSTAANPRQNERVTRGAVFTGGEFIYTLYSPSNVGHVRDLLTMLALLEDDWIGGSGSRGYGAVSFRNLRLQARLMGRSERKDIHQADTLSALLSVWEDIYRRLLIAVI